MKGDFKLVKATPLNRDRLYAALARIAADGRVAPEERESFEYAMRQLRELLAAGLHVEYAEKEGEEL